MRITLILLSFIVVNGSRAQTFKVDSCLFYSTGELRSKFPFNDAMQVKLVSFGVKAGSLTKTIRKIGLPMQGNYVDNEKLDQVITLSQLQVDSLSHILYNTHKELLCKYNQYDYARAFCYFPRNAVLFFGSTGLLIGYIEICFECAGLKTSSKEMFDEALLSNELFKRLQNYFKILSLKTSALELQKEDNSR